METKTNTTEKAMFAAGCFWGVESAFRSIPGVLDVRAGYAGGTTPNPSYEQVCTGRTGHAEVVQVEFDPSRVTFEVLLERFWSMHDPTTPNRQGPDRGTQYRSAIFTHTPQQQAAAEASKRAVERAGKFNHPIVTEIAAASQFYDAEEYHQQYFAKRGIDANCHI